MVKNTIVLIREVVLLLKKGVKGLKSPQPLYINLAELMIDARSKDFLIKYPH